MKPENRRTVFEYDQLRLDGKTFREDHLALLDRWNCSRNPRPIDISRNSIKFAEFVGVIQIGDLIIEILPKIGRFEPEPTSRAKWRNALWDMLQAVGVVRSTTAGDASLRTSTRSLLDTLFDEFLARTDEIVVNGLAKGYVHQEANIGMVRGKIVFNEHIKRNHVHREMNFCRFLTFTSDVIKNQILKRALDIVSNSARLPNASASSKRLLLYFDQIQTLRITPALFRRLQFSRADDHYRDAISIARLIIEGLTPSLSAGGETVLAILFDMNELFEAFVYTLFKRAERHIPGLRVLGQRSKLFWERRCVRPDIILEYRGRRLIVDTKWKTPIMNTPADADLKQMFAYNRVFNSKESYLLYPATPESPVPRTGTYSEGSGMCAMEYIDLFDDQQKLRRNLVQDVSRMLGLNAE